MRILNHTKNLTVHWNHAQVRHLVTPALTGYACEPAHVRMLIKSLPKNQLQLMAEALWHHVADFSDRNVKKAEVARRAGMTVSWLDNSDCPKAKKLRAIGKRYGNQQNSAVRYPLAEVMRIIRECEAQAPRI